MICFVGGMADGSKSTASQQLSWGILVANRTTGRISSRHQAAHSAVICAGMHGALIPNQMAPLLGICKYGDCAGVVGLPRPAAPVVAPGCWGLVHRNLLVDAAASCRTAPAVAYVCCRPAPGAHQSHRHVPSPAAAFVLWHCTIPV